MEVTGGDRHKAYQMLRAVLHELREGWDPTGKPVKQRHREQFLARIQEHIKGDGKVNPEVAAHAVFSLLAKRITGGEIEDVKHILPVEIRDLWP